MMMPQYITNIRFKKGLHAFLVDSIDGPHGEFLDDMLLSINEFCAYEPSQYIYNGLKKDYIGMALWRPKKRT